MVLLLDPCFISTFFFIFVVCPLPPLPWWQTQVKDFQCTVSNLHINEKEHHLKGINCYEMKVVSGFFMGTRWGFMAAVLYLD